MVFQCQNLVSVRLDRAGLMDIDVAAVRRDHALIHPKEGIDHRRIALGAAEEKIDLRVRGGAGQADPLPRRLGKGILPIARFALEIALRKPLQDPGMSALQIITRKM